MLTYLFADKRKDIYTNQKSIQQAIRSGAEPEKIFRKRAIALIYPELSESVTTIPDADLAGVESLPLISALNKGFCDCGSFG